MKLIIIPGLGDSGPEHWQTLWERKFTGSVRVKQRDWDYPDLQSWVAALDAVITAEHSDVILVAHSLGVALVAHWATKHTATNVRGALLVSPSDVDSAEHTPDEVRSFAPMPLNTLPFTSIVAASGNDTFVTLTRAQFFAQKWGAEFSDMGHLGHINAASGVGMWEQGLKLLEKLVEL